MRRLDRAIEFLTNRGYGADPDVVIERLERRLDGIEDPVVVALPGRSQMSQSSSFLRRRGLLVAGAAVAVALLVALPLVFLRGGGDVAVSESPTTPVPTTTIAPVTTTTAAPRATTTSAPETTASATATTTVPVLSWQDGGGWRRVDADPFSGIGLDAVAASGDRLVAFGWNGFTWISDDGISWDGPHAVLPSGPDALFVGPDGVVAAVFHLGGIGVWTSADGVAWEETALIPLGTADYLPGEDQRLALMSGPAGWVLAGVVCPAGPVEGWSGAPSRQPAVWRSADLAVWERVPAADTGLSVEIRDGRPAEQMVALVATEDGYLGAGSILHPDAEDRQPAFFHSIDGREWEVLATLEDLPGEVLGLESGAGGLVAWVETAAVESIGIFGSPDGETWSLLRQETMFPPGADAFYEGLAVSGNWIALGGNEHLHGGPVIAAVLMSPDGANWSLIESEETLGLGEIRAIVPYRTGFAAVGRECAPDLSPCDGRVWLWSDPAG